MRANDRLWHVIAESAGRCRILTLKITFSEYLELLTSNDARLQFEGEPRNRLTFSGYPITVIDRYLPTRERRSHRHA